MPRVKQQHEKNIIIPLPLLTILLHTDKNEVSITKPHLPDSWQAKTRYPFGP